MNARRKLNLAYLNGALFVACIAACLFESWTVFLVVLGTTVATQLYSGSIRISKTSYR